jgi:hypothetical protein
MAAEQNALIGGRALKPNSRNTLCHQISAIYQLPFSDIT